MKYRSIYELISEAKGHVTLLTIKKYFPTASKEDVIDGISQWLDIEAVKVGSK